MRPRLVRVLSVVGCLLVATSAHAAYDSSSATVVTTSATSLTWNITIGSNSNRLLVVSIAGLGVVYDPGTIVSATFDTSQTLTASTSYLAAGPTNSTFYLLAPHSGTHAIAITWTNTLTFAQGAAISWDDVDQSPPWTSYGPYGSSSGVGVGTVDTTGHDNALLVGMVSRNGPGSGTVTVAGSDTGSTLRQLGGTNDILTAVDQGFATPVGTYIVETHDSNTSSFNVGIVLAFEKAGGGGGGGSAPSHILTLGCCQ